MDFLFVILTTLLCTLLGFLRYKYTYWESRGVHQLKTNFLLGHLQYLKSVNFAELLHDIYTEFKGKAILAGAYIYLQPVAVILDLDLVKTILIRDFNNFVDRTEYRNEEKDPLTGHLFALNGEKWRNLRGKLSPTFTSGKMKFMFPTIKAVAKEFEHTFEKEVASSANGAIDLYDLMGRYTTDVIGTCIFGIECNSLKDPDVEFRQVGRRLFHTHHFSIRWRLFLLTYSNIFKYFGFRRSSKRLDEFIMRIVHDTVEAREQHNIQRNDFINLLIELKNSKDPNGMPGLTTEQIAAQVFIFFIAGFETSSSNMSYGLYELAKNQQVQEKLRKEICGVLQKYNGELTYDAMMEMTYLDQTITETLRKYPALAALSRYAKADYEVPGTSIVIEQGTRVLIPVKEIHYDPDIYDNPQEFRPERFDHDETKMRNSEAFLGFGDGPRNCIGMRFGRMQVRIGLITLLKSFRFVPCEKTPNEVEISKHNMVLIPDKGVWLKAEKL